MSELRFARRMGLRVAAATTTLEFVKNAVGPIGKAMAQLAPGWDNVTQINCDGVESSLKSVSEHGAPEWLSADYLASGVYFNKRWVLSFIEMGSAKRPITLFPSEAYGIGLHSGMLWPANNLPDWLNELRSPKHRLTLSPATLMVATDYRQIGVVPPEEIAFDFMGIKKGFFPKAHLEIDSMGDYMGTSQDAQRLLADVVPFIERYVDDPACLKQGDVLKYLS